MSERLIVAVDDGYAQTKVYGMASDGNGFTKKLFRTSIRPGRFGLRTVGGEGAIGGYRTEEGDDFTVSDSVEGEDTKFDGFHTSPLNRVMINHALAHSGYAGKEVELIAGLPVRDYFMGNGDVNVDKVSAKRANLKRKVEATSSKDGLAVIKRVDIGVQAVSAWLDFMLDDNLEYVRESKGKVAIVDIGGRTTDIAVVVNEQGTPAIDNRQSGTQNVGVLDVYAALGEGMRSQFNIRDEFTLEMMDNAVRTKTVHLFGEDNDIAPLVAAAIKEVDGKIAREIDRRLGGAATLRHVVFVGGGSALLTDVASHFKNGIMAPDPEFANARGLLKFQRLSRKMKAAA